MCVGLGLLKYFLAFTYVTSDCVSVSEFKSLVGVPAGIANSAVGTKVCAIT